MDFTFGICATNSNKDLHNMIVDSIISLNIPKYEIIRLGGNLSGNDKDICVTFDESQKNSWITRKKNLLCQQAKYENIVLLHDYIIFQPNWYLGFLKFGNNFDIAMNVILNSDGTRFRDWCLNPYDVIPPLGPINNREFFLPYTETRLTHKMYISGAYWVAKTDFMLKNPLDESLVWGQSEDLRWSEIVRNKTKFQMNQYSVVQCLKYKHCDFKEITLGNLEKIASL
jgi:hypothetical protein